jgi:predicted nucleic acid-binding protein
MTSKTDIIIDTDILIDAGRRIQAAIDYLQVKEQQHNLTISSITHLELLVGGQNKTEQRKIERFLRRFRIIKINETITDIAVDLVRQYRLSHGLVVADGFIAATAISLDVPLASKNQRDYRFINQLKLLTYPK